MMIFGRQHEFNSYEENVCEYHRSINFPERDVGAMGDYWSNITGELLCGSAVVANGAAFDRWSVPLN